ncbi:MAG: outer membrane protein assembly factor, partial [Silicimonas sp.]|nr:outer membrane protein assembly factor [Silicimonas sp.]
MTRFVILGLLLTVLGGLSTPVNAQSNIQIATPGATDDLRDALLASSLLFQASQEKTTDTEELLAAAQADYARILGVLYANARYGGTISISVDGREAAAIPPLSPPSRINTITMRVAPGPLYLFDRAEIRPLAQFTEVPEGFAVGQPAETDTITEAAT